VLSYEGSLTVVINLQSVSHQNLYASDG